MRNAILLLLFMFRGFQCQSGAQSGHVKETQSVKKQLNDSHMQWSTPAQNDEDVDEYYPFMMVMVVSLVIIAIIGFRCYKSVLSFN